MSSLYNLLVKSSTSIFPSRRSLTRSLTLAAVSEDCFPLDASLINVDRKFLHFFTFSIVSVAKVTVVPGDAVTVLWVAPGSAVPIEVPAAAPTTIMGLCRTGGLWSVVVTGGFWRVVVTGAEVGTGEPCLMIVVGVTCLVRMGVPGAWTEVIWKGGVLVGVAGRGAMTPWDWDWDCI